MSELSEIDTLYAPPMTLKQCAKRIAALKEVIAQGLAFIQFMQKLDPAMRLGFFNYLHTQSININYNFSMDPAIAATIQDASGSSDSTRSDHESKIHSKTLAPKKRAVPRKTLSL